MPKLYQHKTDGTYYTRLYWPGVSAIVTRQIHPDGVRLLKRSGVRLDGEIPLYLVDELKERNWLATKEEMPFWGIVDWAPHWHLIDAPGVKPKPFPKMNPFLKKKLDEERAAKRAAIEAERRAKEDAEAQEAAEKREAARERQRRYRARKRAEKEAARLQAEEAERNAEAKRAADRERRRRYAEKKRAEAAQAGSTRSQEAIPLPADAGREEQHGEGQVLIHATDRSPSPESPWSSTWPSVPDQQVAPSPTSANSSLRPKWHLLVMVLVLIVVVMLLSVVMDGMVL